MKAPASALGFILGFCSTVLVGSASSAEIPSAAFSNEAKEAVKAALDPAKGPPIRDPVFDCSHARSHLCSRNKEFAFLGSPGGYFPERAERNLLGGVAVLQCKVAGSGALSDCSVLADFPMTFSFGEASLKMAKDGYLTAKPMADAPENQIARIVVVFPKPPHI